MIRKKKYTKRDIERVLYFEMYVVTEPGMTDLEKGQMLTEEEYLDRLEEWGDEFTAKMGAEAIKDLLGSMDMHAEAEQMREETFSQEERLVVNTC